MADNNMKDYQKMFEEETVCLFDNSKINQFPRKEEKMFFYPSNDWGILPSLVDIGEHGILGDIVSFGLAVADFENKYHHEHPNENAFSIEFGRDMELVQIFLLMHEAWMSGDGERNGYFFDFVYEKLQEMQEAIDSGEYELCSICHSVIRVNDSYHKNGNAFCDKCVKKY